LDLVLVEKPVPGGDDQWYVAGAGLRDGTREWWLGQPLDGSFEYWWEKDTSGSNDAVFRYFVRDEGAAAGLVERRKQELAAGATPFTVQPMSSEMKQALGIVPSPPEGPESLGGSEVPEEVEDSYHHEDLNGSHALSLAMVWRLASELVRRHPDRLWVHAEGGGMYDRVTVIDLRAEPPAWLVTMNAAGSNSLFKSGKMLRWRDAFSDAADPADWVRQAERLSDLPVASMPLPPSTPMSLVPRFLAIFLATQLGSRSKWLPRSNDAVAQYPGLAPRDGRGMKKGSPWPRARNGLPEPPRTSRAGVRSH
jgi:hypothetical protein